MEVAVWSVGSAVAALLARREGARSPVRWLPCSLGRLEQQAVLLSEGTSAEPNLQVQGHAGESLFSHQLLSGFLLPFPFPANHAFLLLF